MKLIEEFPRRFRARHRMAQHLCQYSVFPQLIEILSAVPAHRIEHQKTFYVPGFVKPALPLLQS